MKLSLNLWPLISRLFPVSVRATLAGESESRFLGEPQTQTLSLVRDVNRPDATFGQFFGGDGNPECQTLEPPATHAYPNRTRIPAGRYLCQLRYSPSHGYAVYGYVGVPGFTNVEIHPGNDVYDTEACTLLGRTRSTLQVNGQTVDAVLDSRIAFDAFMQARGCPEYKTLTDWNAVRQWSVQHPDAASFTVVVTDAA